MITLIKSSVNKIIVTVGELAVNPCNQIYLFKFTNSSTKQIFYCIATAQINLTRYQAFCITETTDPNPESAELFFPLLGQYDYTIYENPDSVLDPTGLNVCETGKAQVVPVSNPVTPAFQSTVYPQYQIYGN